jgi:hypothetical protein
MNDEMSCCPGRRWDTELEKNGHGTQLPKHPTAPLAIPEAYIALNADDIEVEEFTGQVGQGGSWLGRDQDHNRQFAPLDPVAKCGSISDLHVSERFHSCSQLLSWTSTHNLPMTIHREPNERDPLLQAENGHTVGRGTGPMEISRSTRHGILAGIWVATFLTVSRSAYHPELQSHPSLYTFY